LFGATAGSFALWDESADALLLTDSTPIQIGDAQDLTLYHDGSNSYITNKTGALKVATETSGIAITLGHTTSEVTVADNLTVTGTITLADGSLALADLDIDGGTDIGAAIADADLFIIDDGAGGTNRKTVASRLKTYIGDNTPAFQVRASAVQNVDDAVSTLLVWGTEDFDTDSAFASNAFTVPSGGDGKYFMYTKCKSDSGTANSLQSMAILFRIDSDERFGTEFFSSGQISGTDEILQGMGLTLTATLDLSAGDVITVYGYCNVTAGQARFLAGDNYSCVFGGYKLIGV